LAGASCTDEAVDVLDSLDMLAPLVELAREAPRTPDGPARCDGPASEEANEGGSSACIKPDSPSIARLTARSSGGVAGWSMGEFSSPE